MVRAVVAGVGSYLPEKIMDNDEISKIVDTSDEWIIERTGIKQRHIAADGENTSDLAAKAAKNALENANLQADDIDLIIVATTTPDNTFPSTATKVQADLGISGGAAFDIQAVCTGFVYALSIADNFIKAGQHKTVMVIGADTLTRLVDWEDRGTCVLFGDGAGALILKAEEGDRGILSHNIHSDGTTRELLYVDGGPSATGTVGKLRMLGKEVFKHAVTKLAKCTEESLKQAGVAKEDVTWVIPHQANLRILEGTIKKLKVPEEKLISTVDIHANTSAASIPLAIDVATKDGRIKQGDIVSLQAIGGGLTWGACLIKW